MSPARPTVVSQTEWDAALAVLEEREVAVAEAMHQLAAWYRAGKLKISEDVREGGLDAYPDVLNLLYSGGNLGKLVLKV